VALTTTGRRPGRINLAVIIGVDMVIVLFVMVVGGAPETPPELPTQPILKQLAIRYA
jgi:hypothetical protein